MPLSWRDNKNRQMLKPGTRVHLWPWDTYAKYGVVRKADRFKVIIEITRIDPGEAYYRPGDVVVLPRDHIIVI